MIVVRFEHQSVFIDGSPVGYTQGLALGRFDLPLSVSIVSMCDEMTLVMPAFRSMFVATLVLCLGQQPLTFAEQTSTGKRTLAEARTLGRERSSFLQKRRVSKSDDTLQPNLDEFTKSIRPVLEKACVPCHGDETQEGNVRIDSLNPDLVNGNDIDWWLEVQAVLSNSEMPPPDEYELADTDRANIIAWLSNEIQVASIARRASGEHSSFRRMTRYEFNYALQDLLGLPYDFAKDLPPEANSEDGFQNSSELLHMSVSQLETYRNTARRALMRATVHGERPATLHWGVSMQDAGRIDWAKQEEQFEKARAESADDLEKQRQRIFELEDQARQPHSRPYFKNLTTGRTVLASWAYSRAKYAHPPTDAPREMPGTLDHVAILPRQRSERFTIELGNRVPDEGIMRVRVRASRVNVDDGVPSLGLLFGWQASNEGRAVLPVPDAERAITASSDAPEFYQWDVPLGEIYPRNSVRNTSKMGAMPNPSEYLRLVNRSVSQGPIRIDYVEVAAPVFDHWPPLSHRRIFPERDRQSDDREYTRQVLAAFMRRAWRRTIGDDEIEGKLRLFAAMRPVCASLEEAVVEVLATVLASPEFLYLKSDAVDSQELTPYELATRLSMFLWCSVPDTELLQLARSGRLSESGVLRGQIARMLSDDRTTRLSKHFVHQWLDLQLLDFRSVPRKLKMLKKAMQQEPIAMFEEMLRTDASVLDFLHADYTLTNERLALHYDLPNVKGNQFQRVQLQSDSRRGGLLTQAGLLAMNSAGDDSHPLKRGVWLLESLLNDPPPPPPPAVPEIDLADPEIAKMSLKEQIEDHRNHPACLSCHAKIDPWGIAFENYDALGRWRNQVQDKPVDSRSRLFNDEELDGIDGLKRYLLENRQDQFVGATVYKLSTFALGRPLVFADRAAVDEITASVRQKGDGLATMIELIVMSDLFRTNLEVDLREDLEPSTVKTDSTGP